MDIYVLIQMLATQFPVVMFIAALLGSLVVMGQAIVLLTPSKKDDEKVAAFVAKHPWVGKAMLALTNFAVIQKK
jgi:NADH:ubiquinone oxidoreductase subunit 3 (subunit A)